MDREIFHIIPASSGPTWFFLGLSAFLLALVGLFGWLAFSSRNVTFEVSPDGLKIAGAMYGRTIPARSLNTDEAKIVNLRTDSEYQLTLRTNGAGLPGYAAGWFRIRKGEKALVFVTDPRRVVYIPTTEGYSVLLSVDETRPFLDAIRRLR